MLISCSAGQKQQGAAGCLKAESAELPAGAVPLSQPALPPSAAASPVERAGRGHNGVSTETVGGVCACGEGVSLRVVKSSWHMHKTSQLLLSRVSAQAVW